MTCNPGKLNKYIYITKTPTWKVRSLYFFGIVSWLLVVYGYIFSIGLDPFFSYIVIPIIFFLTIYHLTSFGLNLFYKKFDLKRHNLLVESFWNNTKGPSVDIFLPICGEDFHVLENTWKYVSEIPYVNKKVYVLDDSKSKCSEHKKLAEKYRFEYLERPNKGEMKKAGNLKYGFERSSGEYIAIFDADFAPHKDFIKETMPYLEDPKIGIVQTPQYFDTSNDSYKKSHLAYNAAFAEEPFYRIIQTTRDRFGGAICCGSNALYRRSALNKIGGPYQIDYSEDAHTGFAITAAGYRVLYIPVNLAVGLCPDNHFAFFHQQHRWSMGSMRLMLSKKFWTAPVPWMTKFCYITGFLFYLHHPFILIFSFHLFWVLFIYNEFIPQGSGLLYYPHLLFAIVYLFAFPIAKIKPGYFEIIIARTYAYSHAVIVSIFKGSVGWVSTNARHSSISPAYRQTMVVVSTLSIIYFLLLLLGIRTGDIHFFDYRYWSVQFWIFWNVGLSGLLMYRLASTAFSVNTAKSLHTQPKSGFSGSIDNTEIVSTKLSVNTVIITFGMIGLSYLFFCVVIGHITFIIGQSLSNYTLVLWFGIYCILLILLTFVIEEIRKNRLNYCFSVLVFIVFSFTMYLLSIKYISNTYDTSWDGQGYHSNGVISLATGWNPVYDSELPIEFPDASIFVKGYPKALWLIQSSIYLSTGNFDSAKITNIVIFFIAFAFSYSFLKKINLSTISSIFISTLIVLQPPFIIQIFSFSEDLFSFELMIIVLSAFGMFLIEKNADKNILSFIVADLLLIGVKYSNLPFAGGMFLLFLAAFVLKNNKNSLRLNYGYIALLFIGALLFLVTPYITNAARYKHLFYPTNLDEINESYKADNIPSNLINSNKLTLLTYGIFGKSQLKAVSKNDLENVAELKLPFTFTLNEIEKSPSIFNNRAGAAGPLFSGTILLSILLMGVLIYLNRVSNGFTKNYAFIAIGIVLLCILITLLNPAPNLLRYNGQIVLIPFLVVISALILSKNFNLLKLVSYITLFAIFVNTSLFLVAVVKNRKNEIAMINDQLFSMRSSSENVVLANNFYSSYIRLSENNVPFEIVDKLNCGSKELLLYTHSTTQFCREDK